MKRAHIIAVSVLMGILVWLFFLSPEFEERVQSGFLTKFGPVLTASGSKLPSGPAKERTPEQLREHIDRLSDELTRVRIEREFVEQLREENDQLRRDLDFVRRSDFDLIAAHVIKRDSLSWWSTVIIDKGSNHGIEKDMAVITQDGVVGKTRQVAEETCAILLLSDEQCEISAGIEGSMQRGITRGRRGMVKTRTQVVLRFLNKDIQIPKGRRVFTEGLGGVYPRGLLIGAVDSFLRRDTHGQVVIAPAVDFSRLKSVFIIRRRAP